LIRFTQIEIENARNDEAVVFLEDIFAAYFATQLHDLVQVTAFGTEIFTECVAHERAKTILVKDILANVAAKPTKISS
jgi:hypothetical protein